MAVRNKLSLRSILTISFLALSMSILLVASGLQIYFNFQAQEKIIATQQQIVAEEAAGAVRGYVSDKFSLLRATANFGDSTNNVGEKIVLEKLIGNEPSLRQVILLDAQGRELQTASRLSNFAQGSMSAFKNSALSQVTQGQIYISHVYIDDATSEPLVVMAVPVKDVFGDFKGMLMAETNLKFIWDVVDAIKIGEKGLAYVVDRDGNLIAFGDTSRVLREENLADLLEVKEFIGGKKSGNELDTSRGILGTEVVATYIALGTPDWAVVTELPVEEAYEPVTQQLIIFVVITTLATLAVILLSVYISNRITKPLIKLRDAANRISRGQLDERVEIKSGNEIGELAQAFDNMRYSLKMVIDEYEKNRSAEDLVKKLKDAVESRESIQKDLTKSERMFRALIENSSDGIALIDKNAKIIYTSPSVTKILGYTKEEFEGGLNLIHPDDMKIAADNLKTLLKKPGTVTTVEVRVKCKDGSWKWIESTGRNMIDDPYINAIVANYRDVTDRKKAQGAKT